MRAAGSKGSKLGTVAALVSLAAAALSSCVGVAATTEIRANGSGRVSLEYRVSRLVEAMGKAESGDRLLPLPFERRELEAALAAAGGLALDSYAAASDETDLTVRAVVSFSDLGALSRLFGAAGRPCAVADAGGRKSLSIRLSEGGGPLDPDLKRLFDTVFKGYQVSLGFVLPAAPSVQGGGEVDAAARTVRYAFPVEELLSSDKPKTWTVSW